MPYPPPDFAVGSWAEISEMEVKVFNQEMPRSKCLIVKQFPFSKPSRCHMPKYWTKTEPIPNMPSGYQANQRSSARREENYTIQGTFLCNSFSLLWWERGNGNRSGNRWWLWIYRCLWDGWGCTAEGEFIFNFLLIEKKSECVCVCVWEKRWFFKSTLSSSFYIFFGFF